MKTAVSIPDDLFEEAERLARRTKRSRSRLYGEAVKEYLARHALDKITDAMNEVCGEMENRTDKFVSAAAIRILRRTEW